MERFAHSTDLWYDAVMCYTRSVAVNSIVGHVLGIGDRHLSNILILQGTGEVVHIDFGIVFEQGKVRIELMGIHSWWFRRLFNFLTSARRPQLQTYPETVPFRLTRNVVDGMGPMGTDGVFMKAAEATLRALKNNSGALLAILSAIVSDPLYAWNLSPIKARRRQEQEKGISNNVGYGTDEAGTIDRNEAAARAVARVQEKLQGYEDGTSGEQQSVEGQIQLLVNSARDRDNLCKLFPGWAPWV